MFRNIRQLKTNNYISIPMKNILFLLLISFTLMTGASAHEPLNLTIAKQRVKHYHDSGAYLQDIANTTQKAMRYLDLRLERNDFHGKKPAIILDIDETSLSNYPTMVRLDFGETKERWHEAEQGLDEAIPPTLKLFRYAKTKNIAVIFLTGRFEDERDITTRNLTNKGFVNFDQLILKDGRYSKMNNSDFKTAMRKQLVANGYIILLNMGDQVSDLRGGYADKIFKLPNPYYLIP